MHDKIMFLLRDGLQACYACFVFVELFSTLYFVYRSPVLFSYTSITLTYMTQWTYQVRNRCWFRRTTQR